MTCKDCIHYEPCYEYGNILDPLGGGVKCDSFKNKADFVEVVRCKDCKFLIQEESTCAICTHDIVYPDDFCSYGERRDT